MKRKIFGFLLTIMIVAVSFVAFSPQSAMALGGRNCGADNLPLGFRAWYAGLCNDKGEIEPPAKDGGDDMTSFIWVAVLNVLFDLLLVSGYLSIGFIIWGGFQYIMSQGDPGRAAKGQRTLTSAVIGMVIVLTASVLVNTARVILSINTKDTWDQDFTAETIANAFNWAYTVAGIVAVAFIVKGSVTYLLSSGDPRKIHQATMSIIYAVIGLVVVLLAAAITNFILSSTSGALNPSSGEEGKEGGYIVLEERIG